MRVQALTRFSSQSQATRRASEASARITYHGGTKRLLSICMRDSAVAEEVAEAELGCRLGDFLVLTRMETVTELYIAL